MGHHLVPQLYLRGFAAPERPDHVWMYDRREQRWSCPAIKKAVQSRAYYTEEAERWLATRIERPGHRALNQIRAGAPLSVDGRLALAAYMAALHTRVRKSHRKQVDSAPHVLPEVVAGVRRRLISDVGDTEPGRLTELLEELDRIAGTYAEELPSDFVQQLRTPWASTRVVAVLLKMTWRLVPAPTGVFYITSDTPLFYFESWGVGTPNAEITFPISSSVAVFGSHAGVPGRTLMTRPSGRLVREANRRLISAADRFVFSASRASWISKVAAKSRPYLSRIQW
jgi:hypothetical protein